MSTFKGAVHSLSKEKLFKRCLTEYIAKLDDVLKKVRYMEEALPSQTLPSQSLPQANMSGGPMAADDASGSRRQKRGAKGNDRRDLV